MIKPETSTRVATNGAEDAAGSNPSLRNKNGNIDPASVPHRTMPINARPTVIATNIQCGPYRFEKYDQTVIRRNPIEPRIRPSPNPDRNSLRITRHQSLSFTSLRASARITSVDA